MTQNAKASVLMYARQDGWTIDDDYIESVNLSQGEVSIFIQFTSRGERISSAISYQPHFVIRSRDKHKLPTLLTWLRGGWKDQTMSTAGTPASDFQVRTALSSLYEIAQTTVDKRWGSPEALLGPVLYRALLAEELLRLIASHAKSSGAEDATVRFMAEGLWDRLTERHPGA
jgi:hypothetical protein